MDIEVDTLQAKKTADQSSAKRTSLGGLGEPEPETIKSSDDEGGFNIKRPNQFSNSQATEPPSESKLFDTATADEEEIDEELDDDYENDFAADDQEEEESIKEIRREQMRNSVLQKDQERLNEYIN